MQTFDLTRLAETARATESGWHECLRVADLSAGLYCLAAGAADGQSPHSEDELYYVVSGRARFTAGDTEHEAVPGALLYVEAGLPHRFHDITQDLTVLVVFGPAEGTRA